MKLKEQLEKKKEFSLDTCTEEELVARCRELRMSEENTNLCIELFIKENKAKSYRRPIKYRRKVGANAKNAIKN